jgi:hypothetical protein
MFENEGEQWLTTLVVRPEHALTDITADLLVGELYIMIFHLAYMKMHSSEELLRKVAGMKKYVTN